MSFSIDTFGKLIVEGKIEEAFVYQASFVPDYLYKYYALVDDEEKDERKFKSLRERSNWFAPSIMQNDPFDMKVAFFDERKAIENGLSDNEVEQIKHIFYDFQNRSLLCSFADTNEQNLPMWAFYANDHKGYCIRYKVMDKMNFHMIMYEKKRIPIFALGKELLALNDKMNGNFDIFQTRIKNSIILMIKLLSIKHVSWKHENEFRLIIPGDEPTNKGKNIENISLGIEPTDLYLGYKCSEHNRGCLIKICNENLCCKVHQANISKQCFLDFHDISK